MIRTLARPVGSPFARLDLLVIFAISIACYCVYFGSIRTTQTTKMSVDKLAEVPDVEIDPDGVFKYVLIKVYAKETADGNEPSKMIVRGNKRGDYHADIYDETLKSTIQPLGLDSECCGGGRIKHTSSEKKINVYGYSQGFGKADHNLTVEILKKAYKDYVITWSDEGY